MILKFKKILSVILPKELFLKVRYYYNLFRKKRKPLINKEEFYNLLIKRLNLRNGDTIFVHSSIDNLNLNFPFYEIISMLREIVGMKGNILFPTHLFTNKCEDNIKNNIPFDVKKTPSDMGILSEFARRQKDSKRSYHPTNSIVSIGPDSEFLVGTHHLDIYPCGIESPYYKLLSKNGKIIGIGARIDKSMTFVHCVEDVLKDQFPIQVRSKELYKCTIIDENKNSLSMDTLLTHPNAEKRDMVNYFKKFISKSSFIQFKFKSAYFFVADSNLIFKQMETLAKNNITIYKKNLV